MMMRWREVLRSVKRAVMGDGKISILEKIYNVAYESMRLTPLSRPQNWKNKVDAPALNIDCQGGEITYTPVH